jgi:hypothetical protein
MRTLTKHYAMLGAAFTLGMMSATAQAGPTGGSGTTSITPIDTSTYGENSGFSQIFERLTLSFGGLPGLLSLGAYLMGIVFALGGILKMKDHVEAPDKHPFKDAAVRLAAGGAFLALPYILTVMTQSIGDPNQNIGAPTLNAGTFNVQ